MELYTKKKRWKIILAILGILIIAASLFYTNMLVAKFARAERRNVRLWADAVHRKLRLVKYTDSFFRQLRQSERQKVELLADVYKRLLNNDNSSDVTFYLNIINRNRDVPVIIIDNRGKVVFYRNLYPKPDTSQLYFRGKLKEEFSVYPPIPIPQTGTKLYYKNSLVFNQLQYVLNDYISVFM